MPKVTQREMASIVQRLLRGIPRQARYRRRKLAPGDNAYAPWSKAARLLEAQRSTKLYENAVENVGDSATSPTRRQLAAQGAFLRRNVKTLALLDAGLARKDFQFPDIRGKNPYPMLSDNFGYFRLQQLKQLQTCIAISENRWSDAVGAALEHLSLSRLLARGNRFLVDFLIAKVVQSGALQSVRHLARTAALPTDEIHRMALALRRPPPTVDAYADTLRAEHTCYFGYVCGAISARLSPGASVADAIGAFVKCQGDGELSGLALWSKESTARAVEFFSRALTDHSLPFDVDDTMRRHAQWLDRVIVELPRAWSRQTSWKTDPSDELERIWPRKVVDAFTGFREWPTSFDRWSESRMESLRRNLRRHINPLGRLMLLGPSIFIPNSCVPQAQADYAGTRIVIAARQYIDRHGGLPVELRDLVDDSLLKEVPIDPFSGKPMRYSRRRGIVWSYWYTEKDHNGREPRNRVWRLPNAT